MHNNKVLAVFPRSKQFRVGLNLLSILLLATLLTACFSKSGSDISLPAIGETTLPVSSETAESDADEPVGVTPDERVCPLIKQQGSIISAHRGGAAYAPENTLIAFQNAQRLGVDELEMDVQLTADGSLVVIHDDTLERTTNCAGQVASYTYQELQQCDAAYWFVPGQGITAPSNSASYPLRGKGVTIPLLTEVLDWYQGVACQPRLSIELKNIPGSRQFDLSGLVLAEKLADEVIPRELETNLVVQSFWPASLTAAQRLIPRVKTQLLTSTESLEPALINPLLSLLGNYDISSPNYTDPLFGKAYVAATQGLGKQVIPYTVDIAADQQKLFALGVDGLITNFPACAQVDQSLSRKLTPEGVPNIPACPESPALPLPVAQVERPALETCRKLRASRWLPASGVEEPNGALRAIAIQYKQAPRYVTSYSHFRTKMRCLMEEFVVPVMRQDRPTLVVFNEDAGLMTLATGARGALLRDLLSTPAGAPLGDAVPIGIVGGLGLLEAAYAPQAIAYMAKFGVLDPRRALFLAATDTFVRAFSQTFSDIAKDYGVYVVASNNQADYYASTDPIDISLFADPELDGVSEVYIASSRQVTNSTFIWGPDEVHPEAPAGAKNLLFKNEKVPITDVEKLVLGIDEGPAMGEAAKVNAAGVKVAGFQLGFATSLPAFQFGYEFGASPPASFSPCADVKESYMSCMEVLGVDVVIQAEANPGRWATYVAGGWQPLEWMGSTWRTVADPHVNFKYNITAMMTGNLFDLPFDGQSAITRRYGSASGGKFVGNDDFVSGKDTANYQYYVGDKPEFLVLAPWVSAAGNREELSRVGQALSPGSGDDLENDYLETAIWADLVH